MDSRLRIYIILLLILLAGVVAIDVNQPKPIDWTPSYSPHDKIPLGLYVFDQEAEDLMDNEVIPFSETPYEFLDAQYNYDTLVKDYRISGTIMAIGQTNMIDEESAKELFYFVSRSNAAFLSMKSFPPVLLDSLGIELKSEMNFTDSIANTFMHPSFAKQQYYVHEDAGTTYFSKVDSLTTTVLGHMQGDSARANFIKVSYGTGDFYLHTQPAAFTNRHLLKGSRYIYTQNILSHLPDNEVYWYTYNRKDQLISNSPLRYVLSQPALRNAWYLFLIGVLFFILFNAKRRQRIIPIITPLTNTTIDFAKTIGNLYYQAKDHDTVIDKKIIYFLERIRTEYLIDTTNLDDTFIRKLQQKSGKDIGDIERAVFLINMHRKSRHESIEEDLIKINNALEKIIH